jgi:hypothetical protein
MEYCRYILNIRTHVESRAHTFSKLILWKVQCSTGPPLHGRGAIVISPRGRTHRYRHTYTSHHSICKLHQSNDRFTESNGAFKRKQDTKLWTICGDATQPKQNDAYALSNKMWGSPLPSEQRTMSRGVRVCSDSLYKLSNNASVRDPRSRNKK